MIYKQYIKKFLANWMNPSTVKTKKYFNQTSHVKRNINMKRLAVGWMTKSKCSSVFVYHLEWWSWHIRHNYVHMATIKCGSGQNVCPTVFPANQLAQAETDMFYQEIIYLHIYISNCVGGLFYRLVG